MEYQKMANLFDNASNQPSKFRRKSCAEINDKSRGTYSVNRQINFKTSVLRSSLYDCSDAYILVKRNISVNNTAAADADADANNTGKKVIFKNCPPFTDCIKKINNIQVDNAKDIEIVMPMYNLIKYSNNYSSGSLWQYCKDIPDVNNDGKIVDFNDASATDSFNFKTKITDQTNDNIVINVEIMVTLK